ncbi:putative 5-methyltetrahydropteroyltriglutamate--homocysteine methyltransferase, partial [Golovinomyces cichoracearum]
QQKSLGLPLFPTTTIGSFPQTNEIRIQLNNYTKGKITPEEYEKFIEKEIQEVVKIQGELNLDVLVHGEPERNDMVQYFGERLDGYAFTTHGWVQSYGSRCVCPPIIIGDLSHPSPMSVLESKDDVIDLEAAGVYVIQVDEPAICEGLPLRVGKERDAYLKWAVGYFRLSVSGIQDSTQIHSHFCHLEFQDFFHAIAALDADVLSI